MKSWICPVGGAQQGFSRINWDLFPGLTSTLHHHLHVAFTCRSDVWLGRICKISRRRVLGKHRTFIVCFPLNQQHKLNETRCSPAKTVDNYTFPSWVDKIWLNCRRGKGRLTSSRDRKCRQAPQEEVGHSKIPRVRPLLRWCCCCCFSH